MVQEYYVERLREVAAQRTRTLAQLRSRADVQRYQKQVLRKLRASFGQTPARTPLNVRTTGEERRRGYVIEKLIYESRPGLCVTANVYRPAKGEGPFPAVLSPLGHSANGKAAANYQAYGRTLGRMGYVALLYDPISQGERLQYPRQGKHYRLKGSTHEHNMTGKQMSLFGEFFGMWRAWDGMRGLDVLLSRPDVDRSRVGVTGNSGGGTLSGYLNALESRFTMAAPSCWSTTYLHNLANELPCDSEQVPPRILEQGLDMADFYIARAPRPLLLIGQEQDFFDSRGLEQAYAELRDIYKRLGAERNVQLHIGPGGHGYQPDGRKAMYAFFNRHAGVRAATTEPRTALEPDETLAASPKGQVHAMRGNRLAHQFNAETASDILEKRRPVGPTKLKRLLPDLLNLPARDQAPTYRILRPDARPEYEGRTIPRFAVRWPYAVETEPGIQTILNVWDTQPRTPKNPNVAHPPVESNLTVYLPHVSSWQDMAERRAPVHAARLWSLDVRGLGQTRALTTNDPEFFAPYGSDYMYAAHGQMLGESYFGRRVHDALASLDLLQELGVKQVHLTGRGIGSLVATFAACLHPLVKRVTLKNALLSYHELTQRALFAWPLSCLPWNILHHTDLPDCYRLLLQQKQLRIIQPWNADMRPWPTQSLRKHLKTLDLPARLTR